MKFIVVFILMILSNPGDEKLASGQNFNLSGTIVEESTGDGLSGARVRITGLDREIFTDFDGKFNVSDLKPGKYTIEISYLSYNTSQLTGIQLDSSHNTLLVSLK